MAAAAASRPTQAAARWSAAREAEVAKGTKTDLFDLMEKHGRGTAYQRHLGTRTRPRGQARAQADRRAPSRRSAPGIGSDVNLLDLEAVVIGGGLGTRFGQPYVEKIERR